MLRTSLGTRILATNPLEPKTNEVDLLSPKHGVHQEEWQEKVTTLVLSFCLKISLTLPPLCIILTVYGIEIRVTYSYS